MIWSYNFELKNLKMHITWKFGTGNFVFLFPYKNKYTHISQKYIRCYIRQNWSKYVCVHKYLVNEFN